MAVYSVAGLLQRYWIRTALLLAGSGIRSRRSASIGIIGGADGPTAIFVTAPHWTACIFPAVLTAAGICGFLWLRKTNRT